jgi:hypothetical protein
MVTDMESDTQTQARALFNRAVRVDPMDAHLRKSFATLSRHRANGGFDAYAALRLLYNNTRSLTPDGTPPHIRRAMAEMLFLHWKRGNVT